MLVILLKPTNTVTREEEGHRILRNVSSGKQNYTEMSGIEITGRDFTDFVNSGSGMFVVFLLIILSNVLLRLTFWSLKLI